ncbi:MAG TPA: hypothetical protein VFE53_03985 [Mucilaginibacter sp.]|jgi:O-antigen/teichoic acid export membrane protein|nr:hypothetical protein [Mucilaginibacter sp.]
MMQKYLKSIWGRLLSPEFLIILVAVIIIALFLFLAWYWLNNWLQSYDYQIKIEWWRLALAVLFDAVMAILIWLPGSKRGTKKFKKIWLNSKHL